MVNNVYKLEKALYGLQQDSRAWYETLSTYLLDNGFHKGKIDKTLFIRRHKSDIFLVQVYVDDIIFGLTKKELCIAFKKMMHEKFQMSSMGELTFFLGLQVKQKQDGIFISQDKYVTEILKKYEFTKVKNASTLMKTQKPLLKDKDGEEVDVYMYRSLKGQPKFGLWYPKDSLFDLVAYIDSDYAEASLDRKSTTGEAEYVAALSCYGQFSTTAKARTVNEEARIHAKVYGKNVIISEASIMRDLQFGDEEGVDYLPTATIFKQISLMRSTVASAIICLATNQKFNIFKWIFESIGRNLDNESEKFLMYPSDSRLINPRKASPGRSSDRGCTGKPYCKQIDYWIGDGLDFTDLTTKIINTIKENENEK
nr:hypothetical protein [Tanacetum cinerariifolium]